MLAQTRPVIVFDCAVPEAHLPVTLTALAHGCHVLGEKPLAASLSEERQMVAAAHPAGPALGRWSQNSGFDANIRRLAAFLRSGAMGPITTVNADFYIGAHFGGFREVMAHVLLLDMAIHTFDATQLIAAADPVAVYCHEWNPTGSWYPAGGPRRWQSFRDEPASALHLSGQLVRRGAAHDVGERLADHRHARQRALGWRSELSGGSGGGKWGVLLDDASGGTASGRHGCQSGRSRRGDSRLRSVCAQWASAGNGGG